MGHNKGWQGWLAFLGEAGPLVQDIITWISSLGAIIVICVLIYFSWKNGLVLANSESNDQQKSQARKSLAWQVFFIFLVGVSTTVILTLMNTVYNTFKNTEEEETPELVGLVWNNVVLCTKIGGKLSV